MGGCVPSGSGGKEAAGYGCGEGSIDKKRPRWDADGEGAAFIPYRRPRPRPSEEAAAGDDCIRARKVLPSDDDEDLRPPYFGEREVDDKAKIFIDNFHRAHHQSAAAADQQ
ncbi:hypothetical protein ACP70R_028781 [Stipagrostis hirtigluma subsp. patula]